MTRDKAMKYVSYDKETGEFRWVYSTSTRKCFRDVAGFVRADGYRVIRIEDTPYMAHRLAWLFHYGEWPENHIDHINGDRCDNRICNLREATVKQNGENRKLHKNNNSGYRNVRWKKERNKWEVSIRHNRKLHFIGLFSNLDDAIDAAKKARDQLFTHHDTPHSS